MSTGQKAATKRTVLMLLRPAWFKRQILAEIDKAERKALKTGIPALFRLNGTSDCDFSDIISDRPLSQFYDYSKIISRIRKNKLNNYDLTFSGSMFSKQSRNCLQVAVRRNYRIAVAFNTKGLTDDALSLDRSLQSFDDTDLRHLDSNVIGVLKRKGSNKAERARDNLKNSSFFVTATNKQEFYKIIQKTAR